MGSVLDLVCVVVIMVGLEILVQQVSCACTIGTCLLSIII